MTRYVILLIIALAGQSLYSQQNTTLFFMPGTPQANFVNPAVTNDCKLIIGLPVISSVHVNAGNSGFSCNQFSKKDRIGNVSYFDTELHTNLLFAGFWVKKNFLTFSVNEKADVFMTYPGDLYAIAREGNSQFEGEPANLGRTGIFLNYRREFAFGIARQNSDFSWGARAKLLFGKLNTTMERSNIEFLTDPVTFDLTFTSDWQMNSSLPINVDRTSSGNIESIEFNDASIGSILLNRKNLGFSGDLGFIKEINKEVTIAGSVLDIGFISWKDNGTAFMQNGSYTYTGPIGDTIDNENYLEHLGRIIRDEFGITSGPKTYVAPLSPRIYLGASYRLNDKVTAGVVGTAKLNKYKITKGLTLSLNKQFSESFTGSVSYSYLFRDFRNVGLGVKVGRSPLQFYAVSDNVLAFLNLAATRNANLRFGLHLNFGCDSNSGKFSGCGCEGMENSARHRSKMNKLLHRRG